MIKPGDVGFVMHKDNLISRAIAWFMGSRWSHSFLVLEVTGDRVYLLETSSFEVTIGALDQYLGKPKVELEVWGLVHTDTEAHRKLITESAYKNYGQGYGYAQLISLGIRRLLMRIGVKIPNFIRWGLVCDHVLLYGYTNSNVPGLRGIDPESIDTEELYQFVRTSEYFKKLEIAQ